jgi:hypothetical protein
MLFGNGGKRPAGRLASSAWLFLCNLGSCIIVVNHSKLVDMFYLSREIVYGFDLGSDDVAAIIFGSRRK